MVVGVGGGAQLGVSQAFLHLSQKLTFGEGLNRVRDRSSSRAAGSGHGIKWALDVVGLYGCTTDSSLQTSPKTPLVQQHDYLLLKADLERRLGTMGRDVSLYTTDYTCSSFRAPSPYTSVTCIALYTLCCG